VPGTCSGADHWLGSVRQGERTGRDIMRESHCAVMTTTDSAEGAEVLARGIVDARLAACVHIVGPIRSIYRWEGDVQSEQEWQCWIKTSADRLDALTEHIKKNHSYDVPEVVALPIVGGSADYLSWVTNETRPA
jgi:periplasmic divalent cation tolerance protein